MKQYIIILLHIFPLFAECQKCITFDGYIDSQLQIDYFDLVYSGCTEI